MGGIDESLSADPVFAGDLSSLKLKTEHRSLKDNERFYRQCLRNSLTYTRELQLIERIGKAGAVFRSLGDPLFDTSSAQGQLLATMLAAIAQFERSLIAERTGDGRKRAMKEGVKFGRKPKLSEYR